MIYRTTNPATGKHIREYLSLDWAETEQKIIAAHLAQINWRGTNHDARRTVLLHLAHLLLKKKENLAIEITHEMGKPITQARAEIDKCAWLCEHYARNAEQYLQPHTINTEMSLTQVCYQPLGIVFAIMPWNFPFWQVLRCAVPAIMAGNSIILKHAPLTLGTGELLQHLFSEAGFPENLFQHLIVDNDIAGKIIAHKQVSALSFTGSEKTGRIVGSQAASHLKKSVLELGGSDPYVILEDADLMLAAQAIVASRLNNCGQVCIAAKRVLAVRDVKEELENNILNLMADYQMADPMCAETNLGPMASYTQRENLHNQVVQSQDCGARCVIGGQIPNTQGFFYPATMLTDVGPGMPAFDEELFGPVIAITQVNDETEALKLANQTRFGLGAAVFTRDRKHGEYIAREKIESGTCFVNALVASDPRVPFGGIKCSGFGRELSREGIMEFVNIKTVAVR